MTVDPRVEPMLKRYMDVLLPEFAWSLVPMRKKKAKHTWAMGDWVLNEEVVQFHFGPTEHLSDTDVESIVVHEVCHGFLHKGRTCDIGSTTDETLCNRLGRLMAPGSARPFHPIRVERATFAKKFFDDEDREALEDVMPYLIVRMPEPERTVLLRVVYDGQSLRAVGADIGISQVHVMRLRDRGFELLRKMLQGDVDE